MLMPDDTVKRDLFSLIKSALTGTPQPLSKDFDLASVLGTVRKHQIENIVYYGAANCGIPTSTPAMQKLFGVVCSALCLNETQIFESERIFAAFEAKNIDFMPLKGTLLKPLYPKNDMRSMSDVDVLIKLEQYDKIRSVMQSLGFSEKTESDHELIWTSSSFVLELHKRIVPSYNKDFYSYFGDGWQLATKKQYEEPIRTVFELRRSTPLSSAAFEGLAVVAYNQPVTKAYVEQVRGVDCSGVISSLVLKGLIEECGRLDLPGRPILYGTTDTFLRCFGLENLSELPPLPEDEEHGFENLSAGSHAEEPTLEDFAQQQLSDKNIILQNNENSEKGE